MRIIKFLGKLILVLIILLICFVFYSDTDYYQIRRQQHLIELDLGLKLSSFPKMIDKKSYGWAEEGGDIALLKVNTNDCEKIDSIIKKFQNNEVSIYDDFSIFKENNISTKNIKTWFKINAHGDFVLYGLDKENCYLYCRNHFE